MCHVPHYSPVTNRQSLLSEHVVSERRTKLSFLRRSVPLKSAFSEKTGFSEIAVRNGLKKFHLCVILGLQQKNRLNSQGQKMVIFKDNVTSAECVVCIEIVRIEKHRDDCTYDIYGADN